MGAELRPLPWRIVHLIDDEPLPVCTEAAAFLDMRWEEPVVDPWRHAPRAAQRCPGLVAMRGLRRVSRQMADVMPGTDGHELLRLACIRHLPPELSYIAESDALVALAH